MNRKLILSISLLTASLLNAMETPPTPHPEFNVYFRFSNLFSNPDNLRELAISGRLEDYKTGIQYILSHPEIIIEPVDEKLKQNFPLYTHIREIMRENLSWKVIEKLELKKEKLDLMRGQDHQTISKDSLHKMEQRYYRHFEKKLNDHSKEYLDTLIKEAATETCHIVLSVLDSADKS